MRPAWVFFLLAFAIATAAAAAEDASVITYSGQAGAQAVLDAKVMGKGSALLGQGEVVSELPFDVSIGAALELKILEAGADGQRRSLGVRDVEFRVNDEARAYEEREPITFEIGLDGAIRSVEEAEAVTTDPLSAAGADVEMLMILNQCLHFSAEPVSPGSVWETQDKVRMPSGNELNIRARSTLEGRVGNLLQITSVMDTPVAMEIPAWGVTLAGTLHAELKRSFDLERGMIVASRGPVVISLRGTLGGAGGTPVSVSSTFQTEMKTASEATTEAAEAQG